MAQPTVLERPTVKLEALEDFEKVSAALNNPNSSQEEYLVRSFGFCGLCRKVTEFEKRSEEVFCKNCNYFFSASLRFLPSFRGGEYYVWQSGDVKFGFPREIKAEIDRLHSRKEQKRLFKEALLQFYERLPPVGSAHDQETV